MDVKYCQSCAMPLSTDELLGTEADGSKNQEYCVYCYSDGSFTSECSMDEMIEQCIPFMVESNPNMSEGVARKMLNDVFPLLKRWKEE